MRTLDTAFESWIVSYLLNSLWQVPLLYGAALLASRIARAAGAKTEHRIWVGALFLQVALPGCDLPLANMGQQVLRFVLDLMQGDAAGGRIGVIVGPGSAGGMTLWWRLSAVFTVIVLVYLTSLLYFTGRMAWGAWTTESMRRRAVPLKMEQGLAGMVRVLEESFGLRRFAVRLAASPTISGPATVSFWKPTLLLPQGFIAKLDDGEVRAVLAHELAHIRRGDFAKNLIYGFVSIPIAYHPALWLTRARVAETRELVCDAMAAEALGGREGYARSLLRLASMLSGGAAPQALHAIGIFDANIFERRVMNLSRKNLEISGLRKTAIAAACALVAFGACGSALALRMDVNKPAKSTNPSKVAVKSDSMTIVSKVTPVYPMEAKKDKVSGVVTVATVIGKDGTIKSAHAVSGPSGLRDSAVTAVKQWRYQPLLLNGNPVDVDTTINITYSLAK